MSAQLLNQNQAAELLALSPYTLEKWRQQGTGPLYLRLGGRAVRYRLADLEEFMEAAVTENTAA